MDNNFGFDWDDLLGKKSAPQATNAFLEAAKMGRELVKKLEAYQSKWGNKLAL